MVREGVSTFVEIGPGQVLSGLIKRISKKVQVINMSDPESIKAVNL
jgi:[acyl-carrier-protein] S-malonyltransferase